jgi:DNA-binding IclR family transcriptional regulator
MPRIANASGGDGVQAVILALQILEYLAGRQDPIGVTALAQQLRTTKSRIYRHLQTLLQQGYIVQAEATDKYRVGSRLVTLGQAVSENFHLVNVGRSMIRELRDELGHFTVLSQPEGEGMRVVTTLSGKSMVEVQVKQGSLLGFHYSAQGKIALAFGDRALIERIARTKLAMITPSTITKQRVLRLEIERIRHQGWATAPNEALVGINALAAPIFAPTGALFGTVAVVDSIQFIAEYPRKSQIAPVMAAAWQISRALGTDMQRISAARGIPAFAAA